jgi:hypothetical protein
VNNPKVEGFGEQGLSHMDWVAGNSMRAVVRSNPKVGLLLGSCNCGAMVLCWSTEI